MREYHPGAVLLHVERASGSRQDLCTEGSMAIYMNYPYYVEFLDDMLKRSSGDDSTTKEKSILQRNLFVALTSQEMIALSRFLSIMHIAVCMPLRWLAGCTHKLGVYDWGPFSMGRAIDSLKDKMNLMVDDPSLILNKNWMMDMWKPFSNELPPFEKYLNETFNKRQMKVIARKSGANVVQYGLLREELFNPTRKSAAATYDRTLELARIAADAIISELLDETKATAKYLSIPDENGEYSEYSFKGASEEKKSMTLWKSATNDEAESVLGSATRNIQVYSRIHISGAGAVSSIKRNRFMDRSAIECEMKPLGLFHTLDEKMREAIILLALDDAIATRNQSNHDLQAQATERRCKSELLKSRDLMKATAEYVEAVCYHDLYSSPACWKGDATIVSRNIAQLTTQKSKYAALKTNILIRVKGFGWHWCRHPWSKNGRKYTVEELSAHLEYILREEKNYAIPRDPVVHVPMRVNLPFLGTPTEQVAELNEKSKGGELEIKRSAASIRRGMNRQRRGEKTIYQMCQPAVRPTLESLIGFRIDVLCKFSGNGASTNRDNNLDDCLIWCQGGVTRVINAKNKEVLVVWDNMHDESGKEVSYAPSSQRLLPSLWMKDVEGAWRMDIAVDVIGEGDDTTRTDLSGDDAIDISFDIDEELETDNIHDSKEVLDNSDIDDGSESECEYDSE
jgi:hypothetical protein